MGTGGRCALAEQFYRRSNLERGTSSKQARFHFVRMDYEFCAPDPERPETEEDRLKRSLSETTAAPAITCDWHSYPWEGRRRWMRSGHSR
jgi:hypothetical protein